jgi:hypothetical protein
MPKESQDKTLTSRYREELRRLISGAVWTERSLIEAIEPGASQGMIQGWLRQQRPTRPPMDALEGLARAKGVAVSELAAELYGETAPGSDRTWSDVAKELSGSSAARAELTAALEPDELLDMATDFIRQAQAKQGRSRTAKGVALAFTSAALLSLGASACGMPSATIHRQEVAAPGVVHSGDFLSLG